GVTALVGLGVSLGGSGGRVGSGGGGWGFGGGGVLGAKGRSLGFSRLTSSNTGTTEGRGGASREESPTETMAMPCTRPETRNAIFRERGSLGPRDLEPSGLPEPGALGRIDSVVLEGMERTPSGLPLFGGFRPPGRGGPGIGQEAQALASLPLDGSHQLHDESVGDGLIAVDDDGHLLVTGPDLPEILLEPDRVG